MCGEVQCAYASEGWDAVWLLVCWEVQFGYECVGRCRVTMSVWGSFSVAMSMGGCSVAMSVLVGAFWL